MSERTRRSLQRAAKMVLLAAIPAIIAALADPNMTTRAAEIAVATAALAGLQKFLTWSDTPDLHH